MDTADSALRLIRPYLWLAALAFLAGFVGYLALGAPRIGPHGTLAADVAVTGPASSDWNVPKAI